MGIAEEKSHRSEPRAISLTSFEVEDAKAALTRLMLGYNETGNGPLFKRREFLLVRLKSYDVDYYSAFLQLYR